MKWPVLVYVVCVCLVCAVKTARLDKDVVGPRFEGPRIEGLRVEGPRIEGLRVEGARVEDSRFLELAVPPEVIDSKDLELLETKSVETSSYGDDGPDPPDPQYPVQHAGPVRDLIVEPLPLIDSDHELMLNLSWLPPPGPLATDYSVEIQSETNTRDCRMTMCYEYNIPGSATWWTVPAYASPVPETCAIRPGCKYSVKVIAHPWDGRTAVEQLVQLDECVAGVCSCAHSPRLPAPRVRAQALFVGEEMFVNVSWSLPPPAYPQRLPKGLSKQFYFVSIGQQMVSDIHPAPWFAHKVTRHVAASGLVADGDGPRFLLLPTVEKSRDKVLKEVKLLARVSLVDERTCMGPAGNATAYDPAKASKVPVDTYVLWLLWISLGGVVLLCIAGSLARGAGAAKRLLRALRPASPACVTHHGWPHT